LNQEREVYVAEKRLSTGTLVEAKARAAELNVTARNGGFARNDAITFAELAKRFIESKKVSRELTTVDTYERVLRDQVIMKIGKIKARKLTSNDVAKVLANAVDVSNRKSRGRALSPGYRAAMRTLIGAVCEYGVKTDVLIKNVVKMVEVPATAHKEHLRFDRDDIQALVKAFLGSALHTIIITAIGTGLRRGELCGLRWSDLNLATGEFTLERSVKNLRQTIVVGKLKTAKSARKDILPAFVLRALKGHRVRQIERHVEIGIRPGEEGYVFDSPEGSVLDPNELSRLFHRFVVRAKIKPIRFHDLRHIYATNCFEAGLPLKTISESLGHSSLAVTSAVYVSVTDQTKREKATVVDGYLGDAVRKGLGSGTTG
jgi:integrase